MHHGLSADPVTEFAPVIVEAKVFDRWPRYCVFGTFSTQVHTVPCGVGSVDLAPASVLAGSHVRCDQIPPDLVQAEHAHYVRPLSDCGGSCCDRGCRVRFGMDPGKRTVPHDVLRIITRFSGVGLLAYGYIKFWDLAAVTYYGSTRR